MKELLFPFSLVYRAGLELDKIFTSPKILPKPVISIGNISWGGTGKTPLVIKTAKYLVSLGLKPCVLTRGYNRISKNTVLVSDGNNTLPDPAVCGDEPYLISEAAKGTIVVSGADRYSAAKTVLDQFPIDVFILDDGFQHWNLKRNLDIVCVNALNPFGNGLLIPAGILREPKDSLKRAGLVVITNCTADEETNKVIKLLSQYGITPVKTKYRPLNFVKLNDNSALNTGQFKNKNVIAVSAIGENKSFRKTLDELGLVVIKHYGFRDHHWFGKKDLEKIVLTEGDAIIVTTSKDAVKIRPILPLIESAYSGRFYALNIEVVFEDGEKKWQDEIKKAARYS